MNSITAWRRHFAKVKRFAHGEMEKPLTDFSHFHFELGEKLNTPKSIFNRSLLLLKRRRQIITFAW